MFADISSLCSVVSFLDLLHNKFAEDTYFAMPKLWHTTGAKSWTTSIKKGIKLAEIQIDIRIYIMNI